jgi:HPt (histidine-containing phosphotransfer) domain-containing protein
MTAPGPSYLDFFTLEAGEYVEQLDGVLLRAGAGAPDTDALQRSARALRGSAQMAKIGMLAELAATVEALGRSLRAGTLTFDPALKGALTAAVDDLKILVRAARTWGPAEDQKAMSRIGDLSKYAGTPAPGAASAGSAAASYFGAEAGSIAAGLDLLATQPSDRAAAATVLQRIRAMRGVAGVREIPALSETAEAAETAVRPLELAAAQLPADNVVVLRSAAELLRAIASAVAAGQSVTTATPQYRAFLSSMDAMASNESGADRIRPVAEYFYDDAGPHVVSQSPNPPTTPAQRFRMEVVSLGEHLHRVIDEARSANDDIQREHARAGLGRALRAIRGTAASFSQMTVAQTVEGYLERTGDLNASALDAISGFAATISPAATAPTPIATSAVGLRMTHVRGAVAALGPHSAPVAPAPVARPVMSPPAAMSPPPPPVARPSAPVAPAAPRTAPPLPVRSAPALQAAASALDASIAAFESIAMERMAEPANLGEDLVPVDALFYRGRAALDRAIELRDGLRRAGGTPAPEVLEEIYDLLDLARVAEPAF